MRYIKNFNESISERSEITSEMKSKLDDINFNTKFDDIEELFVDFIDDGTIEFMQFRKYYHIQESTRTYHDDEDNEFTEPWFYLYNKIYCSIKILNDKNLKAFIEFRDYILQNPDVIDIISYKYSIFNSTLRVSPAGFQINTLEFMCKKVLWL